MICAVDRKRSLTGNGGSVTAPPTLTRPSESYYVLFIPVVRAKTATAVTIINTGHSLTPSHTLTLVKISVSSRNGFKWQFLNNDLS